MTRHIQIGFGTMKGSLTTTALVLLLSTATAVMAAPPNDDFANAIAIASDPVTGSNIDATSQVGEPQTVAWMRDQRSPLGGKSVWWKWTAPASGLYTIKTGDKSGTFPSSDFDTQLGVYTGTNVASLVEVASNESDADYPPGTSKVEIRAVAGKTYYILVDGFEGQTGTIYLYVVPSRYTVAVAVTPDELASFSIDPPQPEGGYTAGAVVTVTALPVEGATFYGWTGDTNSSANPVKVVMNSDKTVIGHLAFDRQIFWQHTNGQVSVWLMITNEFLRGRSIGKVNPAWKLATCADLDLNNTIDLIFQHASGSVEAWMMNTDSSSSSVSLGEPGPQWHLAEAKDFNGDAKADLFFQNKVGHIAVWIMDETQKTNVVQLGKAAVGWRLRTVADLDGDGDLDLIFQKPSGEVAFWRMNGQTREESRMVSTLKIPWRIVAARDFDGDNDVDILFQHSNGRLSMWIMHGINRVDTVILRDGKRIVPNWRACAAQ